MASIVPPARKNKHHVEVDDNQRLSLFSHEKHNLNKPQHLAKLLNWALLDLMAEHQNIVMCGEDIGKKKVVCITLRQNCVSALVKTA